MKVVFVTSCLEPGRDGVGDYTRSLAEESTKLGHRAGLLALQDRYVSWQRGPATLRFGPGLAWEERIAQARQFLIEFEAEWVSVQFVAYGFHPKGLAWGLGERLEQLAQGRLVHLMLHELWIGAETGAALKHRLIGRVQRLGLRRLIGRLRPAVVHSSNPAYVRLLDQMGVPATVLPLFGAIPVRERADDYWFAERLRQAGIPRSGERREDVWLFTFFGTLHPVWPPEPLLGYLEAAARLHQKRIALVAIGRLGAGEAVWQAMVRRYAGRFDFLNLGEQTPERIAQCLRASDFGVATTPWALLGKSATATAMLELGLPVIVNRDDVRFAGGTGAESSGDPWLVKADEGLPRLLGELRRRPARSRLPEVARQWIGDLRKQDGSALAMSPREAGAEAGWMRGSVESTVLGGRR